LGFVPLFVGSGRLRQREAAALRRMRRAAARAVSLSTIGLLSRKDFAAYAAQNAVGAGGGWRAQGDDERAHRNFRLRHFLVLGGLAPRLSSAAMICKCFL